MSILSAPGEEQVVLPGSADALSETTQTLIESETRRIVDECYARALEKLCENRARLDRLAAALLEHETLDELNAYRVPGLERPQVGARRELPAGRSGSSVEPDQTAAVFYIAVAALHGVVAGWNFGAQYFAGYVVEKRFSVDNLFVFVIIMSTFAVPAEHQHRALTFGISLALVMRALFIALGAALLSLFSFMFLIFGLLLIATAMQLFRHRDEDPSVEDDVVVAVARRRLPFTDRYDEGRVVTRWDGRRVLAPLSLVVGTIGTTDILFALIDPGHLRREPRGVHRLPDVRAPARSLRDHAERPAAPQPRAGASSSSAAGTTRRPLG